ncbi:fdxN element excision recombinase XisF [Dulcicalothrix desertica]|nr:fdxN element excision recombinase XisF [Dulcicalothrix desertica]
MKGENSISWGYARVSTEEQTLDSDALGKQIQRLKDAGCSQIYWDVKSRTTESRDGLNRLIEDLKNSAVGEVHSLKFTRIDRIGSSSRLFYSLLEVLKSKQINMVSLDQAIDAESLGGELTIDMLLAASKFEIKMLSHRVKSEMHLRKSQGKANNRAPFGYIVEKGYYVPNQEPLVCLLSTRKEYSYIEVAQLIFEIFFKVESMSQTCRLIHDFFGILASPRNIKEKSLNVLKIDDDKPIKYRTTHIAQVPLYFSKMTIRNILVNPVYAGGTVSDTYDYFENGKRRQRKHFTEWKVLWETHEGIISRAEHEKIKEIIKNNTSNRWVSHQEQDEINPYIDVLKCSHCGGGFSRCCYHVSKGSNPTKNWWYQCSNYRDRRCNKKSTISDKKIDTSIKKLLNVKAAELADIIKKRVELESVPQFIESKELINLRSSLNSLRALQPNEIIEKAILETEKKIDYLVRNMDVPVPDFLKISTLIELLSDDALWDSMTNLDKKRFFREFIHKIIVDAPNVIDITFSFRC